MSNIVDNLVEKISYHSELYYNGEPEISDSEYDKLIKELKSLDPDNEILNDVGAKPAYGTKVQHVYTMGSLNKVNNIEDLKDWYSKSVEKLGDDLDNVVMSPKIDGVAISLIYENGYLKRAVTRGNGEVGQDVTANVKTIKDIPHVLSHNMSCEIRGEIYMQKNVFQNMKLSYSNPRNAAAGILTYKDPEETRKRPLNFMAYNVIGCDIQSEVQRRTHFKKFIPYVPLYVISDNDTFSAHVNKWENEIRKNIDYGIDGLVFSFSYDKAKEFLDEEKFPKYPKSKIAYKFHAEQREAKVRGIEWQVGRTGKVTPVLLINETHIDGSNVKKASLHSLEMFNGLSLGEEDTVLIEKAGDIIPQVVSVTNTNTRNNGKIFDHPTLCPSCQNELEISGAYLFCKNIHCPAQLQRRFLYWFNMLEVNGVGPTVVEVLINNANINKISDIYFMNERDFCNALTSEKTGKKLYEEICLKSMMPLWKFLMAFGISKLGEKKAKIIAERYKTLENFVSTVIKNPSDLYNIYGIGRETVNCMHQQVIEEKSEIYLLESLIEIKNENEKEEDGILKDKTFCLTGKMSKSRKEIKSDIENNGGNVVNNITQNVDFLVQSDPQSNSSKSDKAKKMNVEIISEDELNRMMEKEK